MRGCNRKGFHVNPTGVMSLERLFFLVSPSSCHVLAQEKEGQQTAVGTILLLVFDELDATSNPASEGIFDFLESRGTST